MTQKEKLLKELKELQYDIALESGKPTKQIVESHIAWEAKHYTVANLKKEIEHAKANLAKLQQRNQIEKYFATPEGAARKADLEMQRESNKRAAIKLRDEYIAEAKALIEPTLPKHWKMACSEVEHIYIRLTDPVTGEKVFGHEFELHLNQDWDREDNPRYKVTTNMGTMGSFDPIHDFKRMSLYKTFADIVSNKSLMEAIQSIMIQANGSKQQFRKNMRDIDNQLKNQLA